MLDRPGNAQSHVHVDLIEIKKSAKKLVDLIGADVVVAVGRGISSTLRTVNFWVFSALSGLKSLNRLRQHRPDLKQVPRNPLRCS